MALVEHIESTIGPIDVMVFNIGANSPNSILTETARRYTKMWEMACLAGFLVGREVAKRMVLRPDAQGTAGPSHKGTIIFTGATASLRGSSHFAGFSGGKMALRALAQSMARELHPQGIHVAHVVIDGGIRSARRAEPADNPDSLLDPDAIALSYLNLIRQPRNAWSSELELRPFVERF